MAKAKDMKAATFFYTQLPASSFKLNFRLPKQLGAKKTQHLRASEEKSLLHFFSHQRLPFSRYGYRLERIEKITDPLKRIELVSERVGLNFQPSKSSETCG